MTLDEARGRPPMTRLGRRAPGQLSDVEVDGLVWCLNRELGHGGSTRALAAVTWPAELTA